MSKETKDCFFFQLELPRAFRFRGIGSGSGDRVRSTRVSARRLPSSRLRPHTGVLERVRRSLVSHGLAAPPRPVTATAHDSAT